MKKKFISNISFAEYQNDFSKIKQHIHNGDTYQVNYSHCFSAPFEGDSFEIKSNLFKQNLKTHERKFSRKNNRT